MISEIPNKNIKISAVKNKNDEPLDVVQPLPGWVFFTLFVGTPGSGKTTLAVNLLRKYYKKKYDRIYLFSPSIQNLPEDFTSKLNPKRIQTDLDNLEGIIEELKALPERERTLFVFDDMVKPILDHEKTIMNLVFNRRHISGGVSIMMITQKLNKIPLSIRSGVDTIYFWSLSNKREVEALGADYIQSLDKNEFNDLIAYVTKSDESHKFIFVDLKHNKFYLKFNQLVFD